MGYVAQSGVLPQDAKRPSDGGGWICQSYAGAARVHADGYLSARDRHHGGMCGGATATCAGRPREDVAPSPFRVRSQFGVPSGVNGSGQAVGKFFEVRLNAAKMVGRS